MDKTKQEHEMTAFEREMRAGLKRLNEKIARIEGVHSDTGEPFYLKTRCKFCGKVIDDIPYKEHDCKISEPVMLDPTGHSHTVDTPPAPKFWTLWTADPDKGEERNFCSYHHSSFDTPVYCFTREMWANMLREYSRCSHTVSPLSFINSYLESNGGV